MLPWCSWDQRSRVALSYCSLKLAKSHSSVIISLSLPMSTPTVWASSSQLASDDPWPAALHGPDMKEAVGLEGRSWTFWLLTPCV